MPMQMESLEVLEKADVAPAQARAIVRAIEIEIAGAKDTLATKHDVLALKPDFQALRQDFQALRGELRAEMSELAATLRGEMAVMRGELMAEIHKSVSGVTRQMYLAVLGQLAVMLGVAYFFATHVR
jgi:hypothetical protein